MSRGRGRPPAEWMTFDEALRLLPGSAVLVDRGWHDGGVHGRVVAVRGETLVLRDRVGATLEFGRNQVGRVRSVPALFEDGELVVLDGVAPDRWRGGVVRTIGEKVLVETAQGFQTIREQDLRRAEDVAHAPRRVGRPRVELWQAEAEEARGREGASEWAV